MYDSVTEQKVQVLRMKIMAIDYGDAHTGIAISDRLETLAGFTTVINSRRQEEVVSQKGEGFCHSQVFHCSGW